MSKEIEIRHVGISEEDARQGGILHLWNLTPPDEESTKVTDETIVGLIRQRTSLYRALRRMSNIARKLINGESVRNLDEALSEADHILEGNDLQTLNSDFEVGDRVEVPTMKGGGSITKLRKVGAWVRFDAGMTKDQKEAHRLMHIHPGEEWFVLYSEMKE